MTSVAVAEQKPVVERTKKKFYKTEGFHSFLLLLPYGLLFFTFILLPIIIAIGLSFTYFDVINTPTFAGLNNYITLITGDEIRITKHSALCFGSRCRRIRIIIYYGMDSCSGYS